MSTFSIKRGDTSPAILYEVAPSSVVLTGASAKFSMTMFGSTTPVISLATATIPIATVTPTLGYAWAPTDTATPGAYRAEFQVTYVDGTKETFPNGSDLVINIERDIV